MGEEVTPFSPLTIFGQFLMHCASSMSDIVYDLALLNNINSVISDQGGHAEV